MSSVGISPEEKRPPDISPSTLWPPSIPDHQLIFKIGEGSYGQVWLGRTVTGSYHAVKIVRNSPDAGYAYGREFSGIQHYEPISRAHPSLLDILQVGRAPEFFYYVMELADDAAHLTAPAQTPVSQGSASEITASPAPQAYIPETLKVRLRRENRLSIDRCVQLGSALAEALAELHEHGLVHRDVKPSNIIFVRGEPKLADIGLVTPRDASRSLVGTIGYIPPEGAGSASADLFSLGRVLYEASTGKTVEQYPEPAVNLAADEIEAWAELNEIVLRACHPMMSARYPSARAMLEELERLKAGVSIRRLREAERRMGFFRKVGAVSVALVLVIGTGWIFQAREAGRFRALARENLERLRLLHVATGLRAMDQGDLSTALVWLSEALNLTPPALATVSFQAGSRAASPAPVSDETLQRGRWEAIWRQCPRILRIGAHDGPVACAVFSPDRRRVLTASLDGTACVWGLSDGRVIWRFKHEQPLSFAAFGPDGQRIVTCCEDGAARVWDLTTGQLAYPPLRHEGKVLHAAFSPDNARLVTCGAEGTAKLWDARSGQLVRLLFQTVGEANYVDFSPDGRAFATASDDHVAQIWNTVSGEPIGAPMQHPDDVRQARFSPDGGRVVTACRDGNARIFNAQTGALLTPPMQHSSPLLYALFDPTGNRVVAGGGSSDIDGEVRLWNAFTGEPIARPAFLNVRSRISRFSPDGRYVATGTQGKGLYLWDAATGRQIAPPLPHNQAVWDVEFSVDGHQILSAGRDGAWRLWELAVGSALAPVWHHPAAVIDARWLSDDNQVLVRGVPHSSWHDTGVWDPAANTFKPVGDPSGTVSPFEMLSSGKRCLIGWSASGNIVMRDIETGRSLRTLPWTNATAVLDSSSDDQLILTTDRDKTAWLWNFQTGSRLEPPLVHDQQIRAGTLSPNSQLVVTGTGPANDAPGPGKIWIWSRATGRLLVPPLSVDGTPVLTISPDSRRLLIGSKDITPKAHFAQLIDLSSGRAVGPKLWHSDGVACIQFSPAGRKLVTAGEDGGCRVWDAETGRPITPWLLHKRSVSSIAFAPDGRRMVTACVDGTARIWDTHTGEPLSPVLSHKQWLSCATFDARGNRILTGSYDRTCRIWELPAAPWPNAVLQAMAHLASGLRVDDTGGLSPIPAQDLWLIWRSLQKTASSEFTVSDSDEWNWHRLQEADAESAQQWGAARFHLEQMRSIRPSDTRLREQLALVEAHMKN